jgi:hypothetical protein
MLVPEGGEEVISRILDRLYVGSSDFIEKDLDAMKITHVINVGGGEVKTNRFYYHKHLSDDGNNPDRMFSTILFHLKDMLSNRFVCFEIVLYSVIGEDIYVLEKVAISFSFLL